MMQNRVYRVEVVRESRVSRQEGESRSSWVSYQRRSGCFAVVRTEDVSGTGAWINDAVPPWVGRESGPSLSRCNAANGHYLPEQYRQRTEALKSPVIRVAPIRLGERCHGSTRCGSGRRGNEKCLAIYHVCG